MTSRLDIQRNAKYTCHNMINRVREFRTAKGLTQADLAAEMGVSRNTINSIEKSRYTPSLPLAMALARFFGKTVEEIFDAE